MFNDSPFQFRLLKLVLWTTVWAAYLGVLRSLRMPLAWDIDPQHNRRLFWFSRQHNRQVMSLDLAVW